MPLRGMLPIGGVSTQATGINYHGGPIVPFMKVQALYWGTTPVYTGGPTPGTTGTGAQDGSLIGHFLRNLGGSPYYNINTTYFDQVGGGHTVANSVTYTGFWADNQNVPPANGTTVTDPTMQAEIIRGFTTGNLSYDPQTIYAIFTKGNTNLGGGFGSQYCAYHGDFTWNGNVVLYSAQPYVGQFLNGCSNGTAAPNGDAAADAEVNVLAHEIEETNTDPQLNAWWDSFTGMENADKCAWTWGTTYNNGTGVANMNLGGKDFLVQQNWVNAGNGGCLKAYTAGANQPPVAAFTSSCNNTTRVCNFNGSGSTDDVGIVSYSWNFGDGSAAGTGITPSHTYATTGTFQVTLTVTDGGGLTDAVTHPVTLTSGTNQPPVARWTVSCLPAPAHTCTFDGTSSFDPDGNIVAYKWTNAAGKVLSTLSSFTRNFDRSNTITWTLTVTDNGGKTGKLTKAFSVP
jgi:PKD repeat protein